jgi:hypothetical protein
MRQMAGHQTRSIWPGVDEGASLMVELEEAIVVSGKVSFEASVGPSAAIEESRL